MDIGAILLFLAVVVVAVLFIARPFLEKRRPVPVSGDHELSALMAERDRIITMLQELDFDYALGKIPAEDYPQQRTELLQRGADVLRKIDALSPQETSSSGAENRIEAAVAARRADSAGKTSRGADVDDDLESLIAARRTQRNEKSGGFCSNCGRPILASDRFCPHCGKVVK